jgi:surface polysaccharide O-acyltransferase-like enzyme
MLAESLSWISYYLIGGLYGWIVILALCGFAQTYLKHPSAALTYLNTAILPVYVLHQPVMFAVAYNLFPLGLPLGLEAVILTLATFGGSLAIYHFAIRPVGLIRVMFGLKFRPA